MSKTKVLDNFAALKEVQTEAMQEKVSAQAKQGQETVVAFFQEIKLDDALAELEERALSRDTYYIEEAEYHALLREKDALISEFESIPVVIEKRAMFKELHELLHGKERPAGNGRVIPVVHPDGELSNAYNLLQDELVAAEKAYQDVVLVEVENRIAHLKDRLSETNIRKAEQNEWDAGKK